MDCPSELQMNEFNNEDEFQKHANIKEYTLDGSISKKFENREIYSDQKANQRLPRAACWGCGDGKWVGGRFRDMGMFYVLIMVVFLFIKTPPCI